VPICDLVCHTLCNRRQVVFTNHDSIIIAASCHVGLPAFNEYHLILNEVAGISGLTIDCFRLFFLAQILSLPLCSFMLSLNFINVYTMVSHVHLNMYIRASLI